MVLGSSPSFWKGWAAFLAFFNSKKVVLTFCFQVCWWSIPAVKWPVCTCSLIQVLVLSVYTKRSDVVWFTALKSLWASQAALHRQLSQVQAWVPWIPWRLSSPSFLFTLSSPASLSPLSPTGIIAGFLYLQTGKQFFPAFVLNFLLRCWISLGF